ncbi:CLUMA_CG014655, isoform A [Clunio marinus]|uniref:CLUMA_CG014655, isoform A n=1 Tax=Clunio marinus TaxID=568069 RepID=A0A1J1IM87_9DIPT|nr:CLUMA_CG014655, isoform A [Clunio marinus]
MSFRVSRNFEFSDETSSQKEKHFLRNSNTDQPQTGVANQKNFVKFITKAELTNDLRKMHKL